MQFTTETRVGLFVLAALSIFGGMVLYLGSCSFHGTRHKKYSVYFHNASGLYQKSDIKIAGVKVGWIDEIELLPDNPCRARISMAISKQYILYQNAYALVRQDGLIGGNYVEIVPGDPLLVPLNDGALLSSWGKESVVMNDVVRDVHDITQNITSALNSQDGGIHVLMQAVHAITHKVEDVVSLVERSLVQNEQSIAIIMDDMKAISGGLRDVIPAVGSSVYSVSSRLDRTAQSLQEAVEKASDSLNSAGTIMHDMKIGKGLLGKLLNDEELYKDVRDTARGVRNYVTKIDNMNVVVDSHGEYMCGPAEYVPFEDAKTYVDIRVHPREDHFYLVQVMASQKGSLLRRVLYKNWFNNVGKEFSVDALLADHVAIPELIGRIDSVERIEDTTKYGLQVGKIVNDVAFRAGVFENSFGLALDYDIPFRNDNVRWVTSFEIFDFKGRDRINDKRPHLKWINRLFLFRHIYLTFGADDFISKRNANAFFGCGLRFGDADIKYIAGKVGFGNSIIN